MSLLLDGCMEGISTRADDTFKIVFGTQELNADQGSRLLGYRKKHVKLLLSEENIIHDVEQSVRDLEMNAPGERSMAQKLRAKLFIKWKNCTTTQNFNSFYEAEMLKIMEAIRV